MTFKKQTLAMAISVALSLTLTACSGGSNQSSPVASSSPINTPVASQSGSTNTTTTDTNTADTVNTTTTADTNTAQEENTTTDSSSTDSSSTDSSSTDNSSTDSNTETTEQDDAQTARQKLETAMDPEGEIKWRQYANFIPSSEASASNPLQESQNGKISPQKGAAAYLNGFSSYVDGTNKDFRKESDRTTTNYNAEFMTNADIDPNKVQTLDILNSEGKSVATIQFVNQENLSYSTWKATDTSDDYDSVMSGYVAIPTKAETDLTSKGQVTYRGHTLAQRSPNSNDIHFGDITLNADFGTKKISGQLTNRNDRLLDSSVKRYFPEVSEIYTYDEEDLKDYPELQLISEEAYEEKEAQWEQDLAAEQAKFRTIDVKINETDIKAENGVISFNNALGALSYTNGENTRNTGVIGGIFAGENGQEVTGEIQGSSHFMSFGATEEKK